MKQERDLITTQRYVNKRDPPPQTLIEYVRKTSLRDTILLYLQGTWNQLHLTSIQYSIGGKSFNLIKSFNHLLLYLFSWPLFLFIFLDSLTCIRSTFGFAVSTLRCSRTSPKLSVSALLTRYSMHA